MTPDQLERAARMLCEKRGIDPDSARYITAEDYPVTNLNIAMEELRSLSEAISSLEEVKDRL